MDAREASNASETGMKVDMELYKKIKQLASKKVTAGVKDADKINNIMRTVNGF